MDYINMINDYHPVMNNLFGFRNGREDFAQYHLENLSLKPDIIKELLSLAPHSRPF